MVNIYNIDIHNIPSKAHFSAGYDASNFLHIVVFSSLAIRTTTMRQPAEINEVGFGDLANLSLHFDRY